MGRGEGEKIFVFGFRKGKKMGAVVGFWGLRIFQYFFGYDFFGCR